MKVELMPWTHGRYYGMFADQSKAGLSNNLNYFHCAIITNFGFNWIKTSLEDSRCVVFGWQRMDGFDTPNECVVITSIICM